MYTMQCKPVYSLGDEYTSFMEHPCDSSTTPPDPTPETVYEPCLDSVLYRLFLYLENGVQYSFSVCVCACVCALINKNNNYYYDRTTCK